MGAIRITADTSDVTRAIQLLKAKARPAIARGLNRTADSARTAIVRVMATDLALKVGVVRDQVIVQKATPQNLEVVFRASARRIPLYDFNAKGPMPSRGKGRGVTARLPGGAGRYPRAFIATVGIGRHTGVFQRRGLAKRLPIQELHGPSIWQSFENNRDVAVNRAKELLASNIAHELEYALSKAKA